MFLLKSVVTRTRALVPCQAAFKPSILKSFRITNWVAETGTGNDCFSLSESDSLLLLLDCCVKLNSYLDLLFGFEYVIRWIEYL